MALVGYTNAGKTTVFNSLTGGPRRTPDALFVTMCGACGCPTRAKFLQSDTVGFIDRLPHQLVAAFHVTLEVGANLLLHVIDAAAPDGDRRIAGRPVARRHWRRGRTVVEVYNKVDLVSSAEVARLSSEHPQAVLLSATRGTGGDSRRRHGGAAGDGRGAATPRVRGSGSE